MDMERIESNVRELLSEMTLNMDEYKTLDSDLFDDAGYINFKHPNGFRILVDFDVVDDDEIQLDEVTLEY